MRWWNKSFDMSKKGQVLFCPLDGATISQHKRPGYVTLRVADQNGMYLCTRVLMHICVFK